MSDTFHKPVEAMRSPTPIVVEIHTDHTRAAAPDCCSCVPAGASPDVHAVYATSIAILIIHIIASIVLMGLLFDPDRFGLYILAIFPAIAASAVMMCGACDSKVFYVLIGVVYLAAGAADIVVSVDWYTSEYLPQEINLIIGFLPVTGALVTLVCAGLAFKTACMWEKWPSALPDAPTVLATAPHVV